jgi:hypothetical protein
MQKLLDAHVDYALAGSAANEEFPRPTVPIASPAELPQAAHFGWNAYEIWHSRIRLIPGVASLFLPPQP